jgi:glycosyltransferase involved in cell wall biosynthesis
LAEGFGLPIVEAMLLGVPVLTSRPGATGEIAGDAAMLIDPTDIASMAAAMTALDGNAELRAQYVARGFRRAAAFTPDRCMARLDAVYRTLAAGRQ